MPMLRMANILIVDDHLKAAIAFLGELGLELVGEMVQDEDSHRLCYVRGPEGVMVALAEQLG